MHSLMNMKNSQFTKCNHDKSSTGDIKNWNWQEGCQDRDLKSISIFILCRKYALCKSDYPHGIFYVAVMVLSIFDLHAIFYLGHFKSLGLLQKCIATKLNRLF